MANNFPAAFAPVSMDDAIKYVLGRGVDLGTMQFLLSNSPYLSTMWEGQQARRTENALNAGLDGYSAEQYSPLDFLENIQKQGLMPMLQSMTGSRLFGVPQMPAVNIRRLRF